MTQAIVLGRVQLRRSRRRAYTLMEIAIALSAMATVGLVAALIVRTALQEHRAVMRECMQQNQRHLFARRWLRDAHAARPGTYDRLVAGALADQGHVIEPSSDGRLVGATWYSSPLRWSVNADEDVAYRAVGNAVVREAWRGDQCVGRDVMSTGQRVALRWRLVGDAARAAIEVEIRGADDRSGIAAWTGRLALDKDQGDR